MTKRWSSYPEGRRERALCKIIDDYADDILSKVVYNFAKESKAPDPNREALERWRAALEEELSKLEDLLNGRCCFVGEGFTLADISLYSFLQGLVDRSGYPLEPKFPGLAAWYKRMKEYFGETEGSRPPERA